MNELHDKLIRISEIDDDTDRDHFNLTLSERILPINSQLAESHYRRTGFLVIVLRNDSSHASAID